MGQFLHDMIAFLSSLSVIDFILYFAVLILIILVISLIYVMRTNDFDGEEEIKIKEDDSLDLKQIVETIQENPEPLVDMTKYEAEQEEKAIISYEELLQNSKNYPLNYDDEEIVDNEVHVKKINLEQITNPSAEEMPKVGVKLFLYEREENFLKTLKQLNELLN